MSLELSQCLVTKVQLSGSQYGRLDFYLNLELTPATALQAVKVALCRSFLIDFIRVEIKN